MLFVLSFACKNGTKLNILFLLTFCFYSGGRAFRFITSALGLQMNCQTKTGLLLSCFFLWRRNDCKVSKPRACYKLNIKVIACCCVVFAALCIVLRAVFVHSGIKCKKLMCNRATIALTGALNARPIPRLCRLLFRFDVFFESETTNMLTYNRTFSIGT